MPSYGQSGTAPERTERQIELTPELTPPSPGDQLTVASPDQSPFDSKSGFDPLEFDGTWFSALDQYRGGMLDKARELHRRVAATRALGDVLTPDLIARGRAISLYELDIRNESPLYPPLFLTFAENLDWVVPTDRALHRMAGALKRTPKAYREFVRYVQRQPMGGLFELNVYSALDLAFPGAIPQPRLPSSKKRSDVRIDVDGTDVFIEATVLGEAAYWGNLHKDMHARRSKWWVAPGPGPDHGARRVLSKIATELEQTTEESPNILCLSFFDWDPTPPARKWAIDDAWLGAPYYGRRRDGTTLDLSAIKRLDSIFEFSRNKLITVHVNPTPLDTCRLTPEKREQVRYALGLEAMLIR